MFLMLRRLADFLICAWMFPSAAAVLIRFLKIDGQTTFADKVFLYMMSRGIPAEGDVLEIGSFKGNSSLLLASGNKSSVVRGKVWLVEPRPRPNREVFLRHFEDHGLGQEIELVEAVSQDARAIVKSRFRFIFIDGSHDYEEVRKDILLWKDSLNAGGVIAFHDYTWPGVSRAIEELVLASGQLTSLGTLGGILYFSRGKFGDPGLIARLRGLNRVREKFIGAGKRYGWYKNAEFALKQGI